MRQLTPDEHQSLNRMWRNGTPVREIRAHLQISEDLFYRIVNRLGLPGRKSPTWSHAELNTLRELWQTHSASAIGAILDRSRNSVIGAAYRAGLAKKTPMKNRITIKRPYVPRPRAPRVRAAPIVIPEIVEVPPPEGGVPFIDLKAHHCREVITMPVNDERAVYCGGEAVAGSPWCAAHKRKNTMPYKGGKPWNTRSEQEKSASGFVIRRMPFRMKGST